jgi:AraC-like DNA-binding protein
MGVRARTSRVREWNGVRADAMDWHCAGVSRFDLTSPTYRIGFVLEQSGGLCETRTNPASSRGYATSGRRFLTLTPPDMPVWACSEGIPYTRSLSLALDVGVLNQRLGADLNGRVHFAPRLNFEHERLCTLAEMLAAECRTPGPYGELYGDALIMAVVVEIARLEGSDAHVPRKQALAPRHLRLVTDYMGAQVGGRVTLSELANMTGLSQSHFSRAFKESTGVPPYRWHLNARIKRAQELLLAGRLPIAQVAAATGFADQAHFTRVFVKVTGATPAAWQRDRRC